MNLGEFPTQVAANGLSMCHGPVGGWIGIYASACEIA